MPAIIIAALAASAAIMLWVNIKTGRPVMSMIKTCAAGLILLWCANLLGGELGMPVNINMLSAVSAAILGVPGVAAVIACNAIIL